MKGKFRVQGILYRIEQSLDRITNTGRSLGLFILENPSEVVWLTSKELAEKVNVSKSAITRFCKSFGISNYSELKILISKEISTKEENISKGFGSKEFRKNIPINLYNQIQSSLKDTAYMISNDKIMKAAEMLHKAKTVMCSGIGASYLVAEDLTQKLLRLQKRVFSHYENDLKKIALSGFDKDDLLVAVSYSGKKQEILDLAKTAKERGIPIIAISRYGTTPLSKIADVTLNVASFEHEFRIGALSSRISQLYLVDVLFYTYGLFFEQKATENLRKTYDLINK